MFELRKIGVVKRASAWLLDAILLAVLTTGFMYVISLICNFDEAQQTAIEYDGEYNAFYNKYIEQVAVFYGYTCEEEDGYYIIKKDGADVDVNVVLTDLVASEGNDHDTKAAYDAYMELTERIPPAKATKQYNYVLTMLFMMVSVGLFLSYLVLEFALPMIFGNGQTVGKKVFSICLVRPDCVKISGPALFARSILGKYAVETMFPVLLVFMLLFANGGYVALILLIAMLLLNTILFFATKNRTPIHDIFAVTVAADMSSQMIYASEEELNEKKALAEKEKVINMKS